MAVQLGGMSRAQVQRWNRVLLERYSVRTYDRTPLTPEAVRALAELVPEPLGTARVRVVLVEGSDAARRIFMEIQGSYGRIVGAPAAMLFIAQTRDAGHMAAVGYVGQQAILEATALGLGTCWVTGSFSREDASRYVTLDEGEIVVGVSPVGTGKPGSEPRRKRLPLEEIVEGDISPEWLRLALEAARWAPSARNGQPWRFRVEPGVVTIGYESSGYNGPFAEDPRELDCGIAMANFAVAARAEGIQGGWCLTREDTKLAEFRWVSASAHTGPDGDAG